MAQPARIAYQEPAIRPPERERLRIYPGSRPHKEVSVLSQQTISLIKGLAVVLVVVSVLCFLRIALSSATVITALSSQRISSEISEVESDISTLEIEQSSLLSSSYIKAAATELGMAEPDSTEAIFLSQDVVACDESGNLMLSESLNRAVSAAETSTAAAG